MRGLPGVQERAAEVEEGQHRARMCVEVDGSSEFEIDCRRQLKGQRAPASRTAGSDEGVWGKVGEGSRGWQSESRCA